MDDFYELYRSIKGVTSLAMTGLYLFIGTRSNPKHRVVGIAGLMINALVFLPRPGLLSGLQLLDVIIHVVTWTYYVFTFYFIMKNTGRDSVLLILFASSSMLAGYIFIWFNNDQGGKILLGMTAVALFTGVLVLAMRTMILHYRQGIAMVRVSIIAVVAYQLMFFVNAMFQLTNGFESIGFASFFYLVSLGTILIALPAFVTQIIAIAKDHQLQQQIGLHEKRWSTLMQNAPVAVLLLDREGRINFINTFGAKLLGYDDPHELLHVNWLDNFLLHSELPSLRKLYLEVFNARLTAPAFRNTIKNRNGQEIKMSWVNFVLNDGNDNVERLMSIGLDISSEENAIRLANRLQQQLEKEKIIMPNSPIGGEEEIIGKSKALLYAIQKARQVAITHAPVLLEGETGVGKDMFANLIHKNSSRSDMPFIKVNCGALPKELIEDELFGHEKGAFTSAIQSRKGRFELADGGTLFLDEIGELPLDMQPKLLRALQNGEFERVGGQKTMKVDVRILAATNRNLLEEIQKGNFRGDLYYRLNVFPITIPPLLNRKEDLPELINYFIERKCKKYNKIVENISKVSLQALLDYHWPGNIRELKNVIERAVIVSEGKTLSFEWWHGEDEVAEQVNTLQSLQQVEREHIQAVVERCHWKINGENGAAEVLAMHPNTLRSKMKKLGITRPMSKDAESLTDAGQQEGMLK